jgi:uncharacterized protein with GYD domain
MNFCSCENPQIVAFNEKGSAPSCNLCGLWWDAKQGSKMPLGRRTHESTAGAKPFVRKPLINAPELPMTFTHETIDTEGELGPEMNRERAASVAEELCEFRAEKIRCFSEQGRYFIEITFNACNRRTFTGMSWFLALRGLIRWQKMKAAETAEHAEYVKANRPMLRKIIEFITGN